MGVLWNSIFGAEETSDERRVKILDSIRMHGTMTGAKYKFGSRNATSEFLAFIGPAEQWNRTFGDFPEGAKAVKLVTDNEVAEFINENYIRDEEVMQYAKEHIDEDGYADDEMFDTFFDDTQKLIYIHPSHFAGRIELGKDGHFYLDGPVNKTRDPCVAFVPSCAISKEFNPNSSEKLRNYDIVPPSRAVIRDAYNAECTKLGKKLIE